MIGWLARRVAKRMIKDQTLFATSSDSAAMAEIFGTVPTASGVAVTPENAMQVSAVYACTRLLAGAVSSLPLETYRRSVDGRREEVLNDPLWWLLNEQPNPRWTSASMWEWVVASVLLRRDGYAWIRRNANGGIVELWPLNPTQVQVERVGNELRYYAVEDGRAYGIHQDDMLHFAGFGFDGIRSMSVIEYGARQATGIAFSADVHSGTFYHGGATQKYVIKSPSRLNQGQIDDLRARFMERYSVANATAPLVLTEGLGVDTISMSAVDAQLIESRKFQVEDIARAFGVPPFMIGNQEKTTSWGSGVEMMGRGFLVFTLQPHLKRWEQEINRKFFRNAGKFACFNVDGLSRADMKTRFDAYRQAQGGSQGPGWLSANEIRTMENWPTKEGEDGLYDPAAGNQSGSNTNEPTGPAPAARAPHAGKRKHAADADGKG